MKQKKRVINFILTLVCCLCVFLGSGVESRAEESIRIGVFEYEGIEYPYYYTNYLKSNTYNSYFGCYNYHEFSTNVYMMYVSGTNNLKWLIAVSDEPFKYNYTRRYKDGTLQAVDVSRDASISEINGKSCYTYTCSTDNSYEWSLPFVVTNYNSGTNLSGPFIDYFISDSFNDLFPFIPDFNNYYHEDTDRWLNDLRASIEDDTLYATWDGLAGIGLHVLEGYENMFVQFHIKFIDDKGTPIVTDDEYTDLYDFYTELELNEFSVELSEFDVPEGYRLWCMWAEPYWYFNDDVNSTMFKGKLSYLFFDKNGVSDAPLIKDTGDIYNPLDPNLSNWNAITNFTGDYFYNMGNVMNNTFNNWDSTSMDESNRYLGDSLANYGNQENAIINQVSNNLNGFEFDYYLSFSDKVNAGVAFGSSLINKFFNVSGDYTILFVVGCVMVFVFIVVGIWRFSK